MWHSHLNVWKFVKQKVLFPKGLNWVQHWVSRIGLFKEVESSLSCSLSQSEVGTRKYYNFNMNFESCNFREIKKITCGSSRGLSQMVKVDEYQDTITTQLEICHLSKSGLNEAELILPRAGHLDVTKDQVEQMIIFPQHRHKLAKLWRPPRSCQYPSHSGPRKKHCNERHVIGLETAKNIHAVGF